MNQIKPFVVVATLLSIGIAAVDIPAISQNAPVQEALVAPVDEIPTRLVLKLKERKVYVFKGDKAVVSYPVAVGKKGWETPTGNFKVLQMIRNPSWQNPWTGKVSPPGPKSPLGERWIGFWTDGKNFVGFHGTPGEHLIGQAVSHGCVRMRNKDIKALFEVVTMGTPVIVQP